MKKTTLIFAFKFLFIIFFSSCSDSYNKVKIGEQEWMTENLNVEKFRNGDPILEVKSKQEWQKAQENKTPAWCYYNYEKTNSKKYGKLYNWYAVNDKRGLAPEDWRIPTEGDWTNLIDYLGGRDVAGKKMKFTAFWDNNEIGDSCNGTNESGFSAIPGGECVYGNFSSIGKIGNWWSSTEEYYEGLCVTIMGPNNYSSIYRRSKGDGMSVRCIKD